MLEIFFLMSKEVASLLNKKEEIKPPNQTRENFHPSVGFRQR
jgi:hypothetical protein